MMERKFWLRALAVLLTISLLWGVSENRRADNLKLTTENQYRRSLSDFVTQLDGLETNVAKSRAAGTPTQQVFYLSQSSHQSYLAVKDLSLLPAEKFGLGYINQFLNQVGEFSNVLTQQVAKGDPIKADQKKTLAEMHKRLISVNRDVQEMYVDLNVENIAWFDNPGGQAIWPNRNRVAPAATQGEPDQSPKPGSVRSGLEQLDASLQKLPPFSYTGQTDTHSVPEPLGLPNSVVTEEEASEIATDFLKTIGYTSAAPQISGTTNGPFSGYIFKWESTTVDVCKRGGVVTLFRDERPLDLQTLTTDQAASQAMATLKKLGWNDFVRTATEDFGGYIHLEAVSEEEDSRIYPDKIRLTVGRDNGRITGYDSTPYWLFHHDRSFKKKISLTKAKTKLQPEMKVKESRLAVIPLPGWQEAFCYEFRGSLGDEEYLIYINAVDGTEEKINRIIQTPRGEFLH